MDYENILYEKQAPIAYVTLNRPEKLNALSQDLQLEVRDALEDAGWGDDSHGDPDSCHTPSVRSWQWIAAR